jgi:hypothetical protein
MTILLKSCRCGSTPPTIIPYFSTVRNPGVVLRVPAIVPFHPVDRAISRNLRELFISYVLKSGGGRAHTVAIPLHLARVFKATLSPKSSCLAFPRTTATLVLLFGGTTDPSVIIHSTLDYQLIPKLPGMRSSLAPYISHDLIEEGYTR